MDQAVNCQAITQLKMALIRGAELADQAKKKSLHQGLWIIAGARCQNSTVLEALFIGNCYSYVNILPFLFKDLACDAEYNVKVTSAAKGDYRFLNHAGVVGL